MGGFVGLLDFAGYSVGGGVVAPPDGGFRGTVDFAFYEAGQPGAATAVRDLIQAGIIPFPR